MARGVMRRPCAFVFAVLCMAAGSALCHPQRPPPQPPSSEQKVSLGHSQVKRLLVLSSVPVAFGCFAPAVQLAGSLSDQQALMLQASTYGVAAANVGAVRVLRERSVAISPPTWRAGVELGLWISVAATLEFLGLQRTTATRAGFLVRLSTIFVPVAEAILRRRWPTQLMTFALAGSFIGVLLMVLPASTPTLAACSTANALAAKGAVASSSPCGRVLLGDGLTALAALFYTGHILRLAELAPHCEPWALAMAKCATQLTWTVVATVALTLGSGGSGTFLSALTTCPPRVWRIALFTGTVTCAFPMWAQAYGQQRVRASHASLLYATAPVWNAILSALLLGQFLGQRALVGACLLMVGMAVSIVASASETDDELKR